MSAVQIRLPPPKKKKVNSQANKIQHCHSYESRVRMLKFKTSEKNLENCIISRNNKQGFKLKDEKVSLLVIEPRTKVRN
jgi:phosphopantetheine adenylyltransferase